MPLDPLYIRRTNNQVFIVTDLASKNPELSRVGLLGHWRKQEINKTNGEETKGKCDWLRWGFRLSGSTQLITSPDFPNTLSSLRPPLLPRFCLYLFLPSIWLLSSLHSLLHSSRQTISLTFLAVYLQRPKQTIIFSFVRSPTFSLCGPFQREGDRHVNHVSNIHPIFRIIPFHCVQNRNFIPFHA